MAQIIVTLALYLVLVIPMGTYLYHIAAGEKTFADPVFNRVDNAIYKVCRITREGMNWKQYTLHLLMTNAVMVGVGYLVLRLQSVLLANPNQIEGMEPTLSFNTIISFMTNTNLQHYSGESGLSYLRIAFGIKWANIETYGSSGCLFYHSGRKNGRTVAVPANWND